MALLWRLWAVITPAELWSTSELVMVDKASWAQSNLVRMNEIESRLYFCFWHFSQYIRMCTRVRSTMNSFDDCYILLSTFHSFNHNNQSSMAGAECSCKYVILPPSAPIIQITYSRYHNRCAPISSPCCRYIMQRRRGELQLTARPRVSSVFNDFSHFATPRDGSRSTLELETNLREISQFSLLATRAFSSLLKVTALSMIVKTSRRFV